MGVFGARADDCVSVGVVGRNLIARIVAPGIGITDADHDSLNLAQCFLARLRRHPLESAHALGEGVLDVVHHRLHLRARRRGEVAFDIGPPDSVAEIRVQRIETALGALALLRRARERCAVEGERGPIDLRGQHAGVGIDLVEGEPVFPGLQRLRRDQRREPGDRAGMICAEALLAGELRAGEKRVPIDAGRAPREVGACPHRRRIGEVFALSPGGVCACDRHFEIVDALRLGARVGGASQRQHLLDIGAILAANGRHRGIVREIIFALRQPQAALQDVGQHFARRGEALSDENSEQILGEEIGGVQRVDIGADLLAEHARKRASVGDRGETGEIGLDRRHAGGVDGRGVDEGVVEIGDARRVGSRWRIGVENAVHQFARLPLGGEEGAVERADAGAIGGNFRRALPGAVGVAVEILPRLRACIHGREIEADGVRLGPAAGGANEREHGDGESGSDETVGHGGEPFLGQVFSGRGQGSARGPRRSAALWRQASRRPLPSPKSRLYLTRQSAGRPPSHSFGSSLGTIPTGEIRMSGWEESPGSTRIRRRVIPAESDLRDSATENSLPKAPRLLREPWAQAMVKRWGKSPPRQP